MEAYLLKGSEEVINSVHNDCIIVQIRVEPYHPSRETNSTCDNIILVILLRFKKIKNSFSRRWLLALLQPVGFEPLCRYHQFIPNRQLLVKVRCF